MSQFISHIIQNNNRSGTFSTKSTYIPLHDGNVQVKDWIFDSYGILPSGTTTRVIPVDQAREEYRQRRQNGWTK